MSKNQLASRGQMHRVRWCPVCRNGEAVKRTPTWKARGQTGPYICPNCRNRVFARNYGAYRLFRLGRRWWREGDWKWDRSSLYTFPAPLLPELLAIPAIDARHMLS